MIDDAARSDARTGPHHKIRVIVADDHPIVRSGIATELSRYRDIQILGEAANGNDAFDIVRMYNPDVLVLDINMPGMKAVDLLRRLEEERQISTRVLMITGYNDIEYAVALIKAGAKGYILKDEEPSMIVTAIRMLVEGKTWLSPRVLDDVLDRTVRETDALDEHDLSSREVEVLRFLAGGRSNQEIADSLGITERTVRFHLRNIYDKLGLKRGQAIAWAVQNRFKDV